MRAEEPKEIAVKRQFLAANASMVEAKAPGGGVSRCILLQFGDQNRPWYIHGSQL